MPPSQPAGVHIKGALNVLVAFQQIQQIDPTLVSHWPIVCGAWPTFKQHCHNVSCLVEEFIMLLASHAVINTKHLYNIDKMLDQEDTGPTYRCYINGLCLHSVYSTLKSSKAASAQLKR